VRNLSDGRVELVAEGPSAQLDALRDWCRRGPRLARVTDLQERRLAATGEFKTFEVRYR